MQIKKVIYLSDISICSLYSLMRLLDAASTIGGSVSRCVLWASAYRCELSNGKRKGIEFLSLPGSFESSLWCSRNSVKVACCAFFPFSRSFCSFWSLYSVSRSFNIRSFAFNDMILIRINLWNKKFWLIESYHFLGWEGLIYCGCPIFVEWKKESRCCWRICILWNLISKNYFKENNTVCIRWQ